MASVQYAKNEKSAMQLSFQEKASLDQIIEHAKRCHPVSPNLQMSRNLHVSAMPGPWAKRFCVFGALKNRTNGNLTVKDEKIYSGHIEQEIPKTLENKDYGSFCMTEETSNGVKIGVLYLGKNKAGAECGWLLAFEDTEDTGKGIYVDCGANDKFNYLNWEVIEMYLDKAGTVAKFSDEATKTSIFAKIEGFGGKSIVGAGFDG